MTEQELNEKEAKNIDRVISSLKSILAFYERKAKPRRPLKSIRWALVVAIELCEKQIAKKVISEHEYSEAFEEYGVAFKCPCCKEFLIVTNNKHCWECGQKLDWGNEDAE